MSDAIETAERSQDPITSYSYTWSALLQRCPVFSYWTDLQSDASDISVTIPCDLSIILKEKNFFF